MFGRVHLLAGEGRIAFFAASGANEIERAVFDIVDTVLVAGDVGREDGLDPLALTDGAEDRFADVGVNRANHFVGMVMALEHQVDMTIFHHGQHRGTKERRLFVALMVGAGEEVLVHESHAPLGVGSCCHLPTEPAAQVTFQVLRSERLITVVAAPEILLGEGNQLQVTIGETVVDAGKLRTHAGLKIEGSVGVEMVVVVEERGVIVVAVSRHNRHLHNHRLESLFEPSFPLPRAVVGRTGIHEIAGEDAETCAFLIFRYGLGAQTGRIDILLILDMTVGHVDERELRGFILRSTETGYLAPMPGETDTIRVFGAGLEILGKGFMADVTESQVLVESCFLEDARRGDGVMQGHGSKGVCRDGQHIFARKIRGFGIGLGHNLHLSLPYSFVGEPVESHTCAGVAVDVRYEAVRILFGNRQTSLVEQESDERGHGIVFGMIGLASNGTGTGERDYLGRLVASGRSGRHGSDAVRRCADGIIRCQHDSLFGFGDGHSGEGRGVAEMRTFLGFVVSREPGLLEEMVLEAFVGAALAGRTFVGHVVGGIHKPVLVAVAPHGAVVNRTFGVNATVAVAVVVGYGAMDECPVEIGHSAGIGPVVAGGGAVVNKALFQFGSER